MTALYGLVICGGQSTRMGADKSLLDYYGRAQRYYIYDMLRPFCEKVFLSCNEQQETTIAGNYETIVDAPAYHHTGPMAGLLSAFDRYPDKAFMVVACDYPFFTTNEIKQLAAGRCTGVDSVAFCHYEQDIYEPLLAVYEPSAGALLQAFFSKGGRSLQYFLKEVQAVKLFPATDKTIQSMDTPEAYRIAALETRQKQ